MFCKECGQPLSNNAAVCMKCGVPTRSNGSSDAAIFAGLNQQGLVIFIILLLVCVPLCWIPWVIDSCKGK